MNAFYLFQMDYIEIERKEIVIYLIVAITYFIVITLLSKITEKKGFFSKSV